MKHLFKFESFDDNWVIGKDQMEKVTLQEYANVSNNNYQPFTERELQILTDFCNKNGFKVQARPKEVKPEVKKGRFDKFKDFIVSKFSDKKEEGPKVSEDFIFLVPNAGLGDSGYNKVRVFKSIDDFIYMQFIVSEFNDPVVRDSYRFDDHRTLFKFVEDLIKK
jgi:hypothetical protein